MNAKKRIILSAAVLIGVSSLGIGVGTFAWFTASRKVNLSLTNITAIAGGELKIDVTYHGGSLPGGTLEDKTEVTIDGAKLPDVSSKDGEVFYKKNLSVVSEDKRYDLVADAANQNDYFYLDLDMKFTINNFDAVSYNKVDLGLSFDNDSLSGYLTEIVSSDGTGTLYKAVRVAFLDSETHKALDPDPGLYCADTSVITKGIVGPDAEDSAHEAEQKFATKVDNFIKITEMVIGDSGSGPEATKKLTVRVWLEGNDPNCENVTSDNDTKKTDVKLQFTAKEYKEE